MSSIPTYYCQINTDNVNFISNLLQKENFIQQNSSFTFLKSNLDYKIQIDLSQSFESPSIICCCSTIPISLPQLLSFLNPNSTKKIYLFLFIQSTDPIDWNPLISLITAYDLSLNIINDKNDFSFKLSDIINNLAKQNLTRRSISVKNNDQKSTAETQVNYFIH